MVNDFKSFNPHLIGFRESLNMDQLELCNRMNREKLLTICIPTGGGKGYIFQYDIADRIVNTNQRVFSVVSHRLLLNVQHFGDLFDRLNFLLGKVSYIFVGSYKYSMNKKINSDKELKGDAKLALEYEQAFYQKIKEYKLNKGDVFTSISKKSDLKKCVNRHLADGRKVIIISTYHSLGKLSDVNIDTAYFDEAHTLASEDETSKFIVGYKSLKCKRRYFLTATPRDCATPTRADETFLMNNVSIFGERVGPSFKECVQNGYIVRPIVHTAFPDTINGDTEFKSTFGNMVKFLTDIFIAHNKFVKENSTNPDEICGKLLVKCSSVEEMWKLSDLIKVNLPDVVVCAGASKGKTKDDFKHYIGDKGMNDRSDYLSEICNFDDTTKLIVLHFDTMSEGINVAFTGVCFFSEYVPTIIKILQNVGRGTRLSKKDRLALAQSNITPDDLTNWFKPYCWVILPYWDNMRKNSARSIEKDIASLRDEIGFDNTFKISIGKDTSNDGDPKSPDPLNNGEKRIVKRISVKKIVHKIENYYLDMQKVKEANRISKLSIEEQFNELCVKK